jgi:hypothetical protein
MASIRQLKRLLLSKGARSYAEGNVARTVALRLKRPKPLPVVAAPKKVRRRVGRETRYVYVLFDKREPDRPRYAGQTRDPDRRLHFHLDLGNQRTNRRLRDWKQEVGENLGMRVVQICTELTVDRRETHWIRSLRREHGRWNVFNICDNSPRSKARLRARREAREQVKLPQVPVRLPGFDDSLTKGQRARRRKKAVKANHLVAVVAGLRTPIPEGQPPKRLRPEEVRKLQALGLHVEVEGVKGFDRDRQSRKRKS